MAVAFVAAPPAQGAPVVTYACTPAPEDCAGWFRSDVTVTWTVTPPEDGKGCKPDTFTDDTSGKEAKCSAGKGHDKVTARAMIQLDKTPPQITDAIPERPPDHAGWFTSAVRFDFSATDATSGLAGCRSASYDGPDAAAASILGICEDQAGNRSSRAFGLMFDATPPSMSGLTATPGDRLVALRWQSSRDATSVEVRRVPGHGSQPASVVFTGRGSSFTDDRVDNGVRYVYRVRLADAAGNETSEAIAAVPSGPTPDTPVAGVAPNPAPAPVPVVGRPRARLLSPAANATVRTRRPPLLRWMPVQGAGYYNVQLFRGARKVLSVWPVRPRYQVKKRWTLHGTPQRLRRGRYRWYVWPGFGARPKSEYGDLLGRRAFTVVGR